MTCQLIQKYNVPGPRYTSYPTVPYWDNDDFSVSKWKETLVHSFTESNAGEGISLYIHLPFCESLCTFCGCHKRITKNHGVEETYMRAVQKEWRLYCDLLPQRPRIKELHLGGGTPTFFSPGHLQDLINGIFSTATRAENAELSFEGHPNNTTKEHLQALYDVGFRRVSFGVQDYSPVVQQAIHRIQPLQHVARVMLWARETGYTSIANDLIYGLPMQTLADVVDTVEKTQSLLPDRIALYSYAHVPWIKGNGQRGFRDEDIPKDEEKRVLYETAKRMLTEKGYHEIGMDHFALETDSLYRAAQNGNLHRNFMGYNASKTQVMIGLGVSSISDSWYAFAQNAKNLEDYYQMLEWDTIPVVKGHILTKEDLVIRKHILNLMCRLETSWEHQHLYFSELPEVLSRLSQMEADGLVVRDGHTLRITPAGMPFVRNVCMAFDLRLIRSAPQTQLFSMTI